MSLLSEQPGAYRVSVETRFSATHQLRLPNGELEPLHGHDWFVRALFAANKLDSHGMVVDFHAAQSVLQAVVDHFQYAHLNEQSVLGNANPTAEVLAKKIFDQLLAKGLGTVCRVCVTEAPGCTAEYGRTQDFRSD